MKKIFVYSALAFILFACSNAADDSKPGSADTANGVDTTVIGSDNPNPLPDTTGTDSIMDSIKNK